MIPPVIAHAGEAHIPLSRIAGWWTWEPFVTTLLALSAILYAIGLARLWRNAGVGRGIRSWQAASFYAGWLSMVAVLVSPIDALSDIFFSVHMAQHEVLMVIAAPLLVFGRPLIAMTWALPKEWRSPVAASMQSGAFALLWRRISAPLTATVIHAVTLWIWHIPSLFEAALANEFVHGVQHASFLLTAALFWWALVYGRYGRVGYGIGVLYVFVTTLHSGALGALMTFSTHVWYPFYSRTAVRWGFNPIEDQELAGLIMWIPAGVILLVIGLALFALWLSESERRSRITRTTYSSEGES